MAVAGGEPLELRFDRATVELDALQRATYALAAIASTDISSDHASYICRLYPRTDDVDRDGLCHRLRDEVVDQTLRIRIARETEQVRNLVFALAFSRTGLSEDGLPES